MSHENRLRISVLDAGRTLIRHLARFPDVKPQDAVRQLAFGPCYLASYDFEGALPIVVDFPGQIFRLLDDRSAELRHAIFELAKLDQPFWARAAIYGRQKALKLMNDDQTQCLKDAGLADNPLEGEPRLWWQRLSSEFRLRMDADLRRLGSEAEELTLNYEGKRLDRLGISRNPYLVSGEDETAGYDVHSYLLENGAVFPLYIEVKGTTALEPRFFLSRNEWDTCVRLHPRYLVHVWELTKGRLTIFSRDDLKLHIPMDIGLGTWMDIRIVLKGTDTTST